MMKSEANDSVSCWQQGNENISLLYEIKVEESKIEGSSTIDVNCGAAVDNGEMLTGVCEAPCKSEQMSSDWLCGKMISTNVPSEKISLVQKTDINIDVVSDFDESDFEIEPFHPMELESETDEFIDNCNVPPPYTKKLSKRMNKTTSKVNLMLKNENASKNYFKKLKIILKDFLFDRQTNSKVVLKEISINLVNNGYCNNNYLKMETATLSKSAKNAKRSAKTKKQTVIKSKRNQPKKEKFTCTHCAEIFVTNRQLNRHLWKEHRKEIQSGAKQLFSCDICEYVTNLKPCLKRHKWTHGIGEVIHCSECEYVTAIPSALTKHINNVHKRSEKVLYKCEHCKRSFSWKYTLANHLLGRHKDKFDMGLEKMFIWTIKHCSLCDYRTVHEYHLKNHMKKHKVGDNVLKCYHCSYETVSKSSITTHLGTHTIGKFSCRFCGHTFKSQYLLDSHLLRYHEGHVADIEQQLDNRTYSCALCSHKTLHRNTLKLHMVSQHKEVAVAKYGCELCEFTSDLRKDLHEHYQRKHDKEYYVCELCSKAYTEPNYLANHVLRSHNSKRGRELFKKYNCRVYLCKFCNDYKTTVHKSYKRHMHTIHGSEFRCTKCDFKTGREYYLKSHIKVNHATNDKTFKCILCQNPPFKHKHSLANHILKQHSSEATEDTVLGHKVHYCSLCSYKDVVMAHIKRHMRSMHTDL